MRGEVRRADLIDALQALGGRVYKRGGETLIRFPGTTITIGRRNFNRAMLIRLGRKLRKADIPPISLHEQLMRR